MTRLRAVLFQTVWFLWTAILVIVAIPTLYLPSKYLQAFAGAWARHTNFLLKWIMGVRIEIRGQDHIPREAVIVAAKHQSLWETIYLLSALHQPAFILKKELMRIPVFGLMCRKLKMVTVDRSGGSTALRSMVEEAREAQSNGRSIVIFPQGTRTPPGTSVANAAYRPGIAALYRAIGCRVTPVALNSGYCWPKKLFQQQPGRIIVEYLPMIESGIARKKFMTRLIQEIETASEKLEAEAPPDRNATPG